MRAPILRDRLMDRSFSVRFFDVLVRSMVTVADACAALLARLGFSDLGPLTLAVGRGSVNDRFRPARLARRPGPSVVTLDMGSELACVPSGQSNAVA